MLDHRHTVRPGLAAWVALVLAASVSFAATDALASDPPTTAWLAEACAPLRFAEDGPDVAAPDPDAFERRLVEVLAASEDALHIRMPNTQAPLSVWLPNACFGPVLRHDLRLEVPNGNAALTLLGGLPAPCAPEGGTCEFRPGLFPELELRLDASAVGRTGESDATPPAIERMATVELVGRDALCLAPSSAATCAENPESYSVAVRAKTDLDVPWFGVTVHVGAGLWEVFAPSDALRRTRWGEHGYLVTLPVVPPTEQLPKWVDVRAGVHLRAEPAGAKVGRVSARSHWFEAGSQRPEWVQVKVETPGWEPVGVWTRARYVSAIELDE